MNIARGSSQKALWNLSSGMNYSEDISAQRLRKWLKNADVITFKEL